MFLSFSQLPHLKVLNHSPMSDASVNFDCKSPSPCDRTDQEEKIEDVASHCLPQKDLYTAEEETETLFPRKMTAHNGMEDSGGGGTGVKKKRKKKDPGEQEGAAKGSKDREPKPKRKREPREPKQPREPRRAREPKQRDGTKKPRKPREASGTKEAKEKRSGADTSARTKSRKARCIPFSLLSALGSIAIEWFAFGFASAPGHSFATFGQNEPLSYFLTRKMTLILVL